MALAVVLALASSALGNGAKWLQDNCFPSGGAGHYIALRIITALRLWASETCLFGVCIL